MKVEEPSGTSAPPHSAPVAGRQPHSSFEDAVKQHGGWRRRHGPENPLVAFVRRNALELALVLVAALGVFLMLERTALRVTLSGWAYRLVEATLAATSRLDEGLYALVSRVSLADRVGIALVVVALVVAALRLRHRLLHNPALAAKTCPACGGRLNRVHRTGVDRAIDLYVPVRRYRCRETGCSWEGLRVKPPSPARPQQDTSDSRFPTK
jgi:hypothetical protein